MTPLSRKGEPAKSEAGSRRLGYNSRGEPEMYPSDIQSLQTRYGLTIPEAEDLWHRSVVGDEDPDSVAKSLVLGRVVYRARYEAVTNPADHALTAVQVKAAHEEEQRQTDKAKVASRVGAVTTPTSDRTQPEAGPHGPYADYHSVTVPVEEVAHNANLTPQQVKDVGLGGK